VRKLLYALFGFLNGYLLLHPISMVLFVSLAEHQASAAPQPSALAVLHSSFSLAMLPMALGFGALGVIVSLVYEGQSNRLASEKDRLRREVIRSEALVEELERRASQLNEQKQKLLDLQEMRERTIGFLVHDFKNQLGCIEGFSEVLLDRAEIAHDPETQRPLVTIRRQARAMISSVRNLLDIARLEERPGLRKELISPAILLQSIAADDYAPDGRYEISIAPETKECRPVLAEPELIQRVILNLVRNAIKHQRPDVRITLHAACDSSDQAIVFTCHDDGKPIAPDIRTQLFKPYRVGNQARSDSTGLGLVFAKAAVEAHGGRIWHDSSEEDGNSFHFTIPADPADR
jgi:two-component system sensor histidine kinase/response regulator